MREGEPQFHYNKGYCFGRECRQFARARIGSKCVKAARELVTQQIAAERDKDRVRRCHLRGP